jgi:RimJ/RimL family protein N-acetyltransferase
MATVLETERLLLRELTLEDAEALLEVYRDSEVMRYIGTGATFQDVEEVRERMRRARDHYARRGFGFWGVVEKATGKLIGACGIKELEGGPDIEVGYHLARAAWGRGYATEAAGACLRYAFERVGLDRVLGVVQPPNGASRRVLEKIGMTFERLGHYYGNDCRVYVATRPADVQDV